MKLRSRITKFWGNRRRITPRLLDTIFGDGKQFIYITPINTRPNYYVARIDSKIDINNEHFLDSELVDVLNTIEETYGSSRGIKDGNYPFPSLDLDCGYCWGRIDKCEENEILEFIKNNDKSSELK